ncbi:MAG: MBL fold metallo-hydrolase [Rhodospirillales bacterium]|nr:MBL fold metallo-hydrolase [Rhodospirillales bacterium]MDE2197451.1 MBL fold metallo-hydrolase [Rhodospirillales bacterium]
MSVSLAAPPLRFPHPEPPAPGGMVDVALGIRWLRLALPFQLDHVNIYLLADGSRDGRPGWAVLDTGIADRPTRAVWEQISRSHRLTRLIGTHFHPDHIGLAGWMCETFDLPLAMSRTEYLFSQNLRHNPDALGSAAHRAFYLRHGLGVAATEAVMTRGHAYLGMTTGLPPEFAGLVAGETLQVGSRCFDILTGGGHAPEQVMLHDRAAGIFLAADQVLARISPNIGVWPWEPLADPLGAYLRSLAALRDAVPDDVLVLPAHNLPFYGLHQRLGELEDHHAQRCDAIATACDTPRTATEILPVLFHRPLDDHQTGFAFSEVLAHLNLMVRAGSLRRLPVVDGVERFVRA